MANGWLAALGGLLVVVGVLVSGSGRDQSTRIGNTGFSVFGSVKQSFRGSGLAIRGQRQKSARDWVGWGISGAGLAVGMYSLFGG